MNGRLTASVKPFGGGVSDAAAVRCRGRSQSADLPCGSVGVACAGSCQGPRALGGVGARDSQIYQRPARCWRDCVPPAALRVSGNPSCLHEVRQRRGYPMRSVQMASWPSARIRRLDTQPGLRQLRDVIACTLCTSMRFFARRHRRAGPVGLAHSRRARAASCIAPRVRLNATMYPLCLPSRWTAGSEVVPHVAADSLRLDLDRQLLEEGGGGANNDGRQRDARRAPGSALGAAPLQVRHPYARGLRLRPPSRLMSCMPPTRSLAGRHHCPSASIQRSRRGLAGGTN